MQQVKTPATINRISFYDFDLTLVDEPMPDLGKQIWKHKTGEEFPHIGWWSKEESLNIEVFDFIPIMEVVNRLKTDYEDPLCWTVLLSNRMEKLLPSVQKILGLLNIDLDDYLLRGRDNLSKTVRIKRTLAKFSQANQIEIHEDDVNNIAMMKDMATELVTEGYNISIFQVLPAGNANRRVRVL